MFIVVKNPPSTPVQLSQIIPNVVDEIYDDVTIAEGDAVNLANSNPGNLYAVFQLVVLGTAISPVIASPPAKWSPVNVLVTNLTDTITT